MLQISKLKISEDLSIEKTWQARIAKSKNPENLSILNMTLEQQTSRTMFSLDEKMP